MGDHERNIETFYSHMHVTNFRTLKMRNRIECLVLSTELITKGNLVIIKRFEC